MIISLMMNLGMFSPGAQPVADPQLFPIIRDWYKRPRGKSWKDEQDELAEAIRSQRVALGILPDDEIPQAAVKAVAAVRVEQRDDESAQRYLASLDASRAAFVNAWLAGERDKERRKQAEELWKLEIEMRRLVLARRKSIVLLLLN